MQVEITKATVVKGSVRKVGDVLELDDREAQRLIQKGVAKQAAVTAAGRRALSNTATETKPES